MDMLCCFINQFNQQNYELVHDVLLVIAAADFKSVIEEDMG